MEHGKPCFTTCGQKTCVLWARQEHPLRVELLAILIGVVFLSGPVIWFCYSHTLKVERLLLETSELLDLRNRQEQRERTRRIAYERALNLPVTEPDRTQCLWARAHQGDELAEEILSEEMTLETDQLQSFRGPDEQTF